MSRRKAWIAGALAVIALLGVWLGLREETQPQSSDEEAPAAHSTVTRRDKAHSAPKPPPSGALQIRGTVRDEQGPVAGVRVSATRPTPGETLSELPCPVDPDGTMPREERLPDCLERATPLVLELVGAREGEAPVYAEAVTAADGSFVLDGLPEGDFTLWALGERGAELRSGVKAGAQDVALVLNEGVTLEGMIVDPEEQPLPWVELTLLHEQHTRFFDTRSGADGRFRIGPLPKGNYGLVAASEGWLPEFLSHEYLGMMHFKVTLVRPTRLKGRVLLNGAPVPNVDVAVRARLCLNRTPEQHLKTNAEGRFVLEDLGVCTYEFTATRGDQFAVSEVELNPLIKPPDEVVLNLGQGFQVEGTVRDDARHPVADAQVIVRPAGVYNRTWRATTDAEGHYRLGPVEAGSYLFDVSTPRYIDLDSEQHELTRDTGPVDLTLEHALSIAGQVVDEEGVPVPDIRLRLTGHPREPGKPYTIPENDSSDSEGRFLLDTSQAGAWRIEVEGHGFLPQSLSVQAPTEGVRIVLHRGATVMGTVTDERGSPQHEATVALWQEDPQGDPIHHAQTDAQGHFTLQGLPAGRYVVEAIVGLDGTERTVSKNIELRGTEQLDVELRFEEGHSLNGIVVDDSGQPIADVSILLAPSTDDSPSWRQGLEGVCEGCRSHEASTGPDGRFTLKHLVAETYVLNAWKVGYTIDPAQAPDTKPRARRGLIVREGATEARVVLKRQGRILGRLLGPDGTPLQYFQVNGEHTRNPKGTFERPFRKSGIQHLTFSAPDLATTLRSVKVQEGVDLDIGDVRMEPGRRVRGLVVDAETGAPVSRARVQVVEVSLGTGGHFNESGDSVSTRGDGTFELTDVEPKPLTLMARHSGYRMSQASVGPSEDFVTLRLEGGVQVGVTVRDHEGKPIGAYVALISMDGTNNSEQIMVTDGTLNRTGLEPGLYVAKAIPNDLRLESRFSPQEVQIPASGIVTLDFTERGQGATLRLRVEGSPDRVEMVVVPGAAPPSFSKDSLRRWLTRGVIAEHAEGVMQIPYLPPGHSTILLVHFASTLQFYLEELDVPAEGTVERVVNPNWQPIPEE